MITLDTSGLLALINTGDRDHAACRAVFERDGGPFIIPVATLSEIAWTLETKLHSRVEDSFLDDLADEVYTLDWHQRDVPRVRELSRRYRDLRLGIADAAVIACAEPHGGRVLTTDRRHFPVVARGERTITVLPD
ncbi:MAG: PIN domain-containing protein [Chloroflexi bacterium]|nr:PIN domain-containing protein [Chloroflexota bacterium]